MLSCNFCYQQGHDRRFPNELELHNHQQTFHKVELSVIHTDEIDFKRLKSINHKKLILVYFIAAVISIYIGIEYFLYQVDTYGICHVVNNVKTCWVEWIPQPRQNFN